MRKSAPVRSSSLRGQPVRVVPDGIASCRKISVHVIVESNDRDAEHSARPDGRETHGTEDL
jgi:hypothetical protein